MLLFATVLHVSTHGQQTSLCLYGPYRKTFLILQIKKTNNKKKLQSSQSSSIIKTISDVKNTFFE